MRWAAAIAAAAAVSVAVYLSLDPDRAGDFQQMAAWTSRWLAGQHLYSGADLSDYPPWAIVAFSSLAVMPLGVWVALNVVMLGASTFVLARARQSPGAFPLALWCWLIAAGAGRTLGQFSLAAFTVGVIGVHARRPTLRWILVGLSLVKPQIGGVFILVLLCARAWRTVASAVVVPVLLTLIYCVRVRLGPIDVMHDYALAMTHLADAVGPGRTEWTGVLLPWMPRLLAAVVVAIVAAAPLVWAPHGEAAVRSGAVWLYAAVALLVAWRHLSYDFLLLVPWLSFTTGWRLALGALLIGLNPSLLARLGHFSEPAIRQADRAAVIALWGAGFIWLGRRSER